MTTRVDRRGSNGCLLRVWVTGSRVMFEDETGAFKVVSFPLRWRLEVHVEGGRGIRLKYRGQQYRTI